MNFHTYFATARPAVETCVVGSGGFGRSFLAQSLRMPKMQARVAVDLDAKTAAEAFAAVGVERRRIRICTTAREAAAAWEAGDFIASDRLEAVVELPIDIVVEATGHPEAGARHGKVALDAGRHLALVSKEVDSVVGPGLSLLARKSGLVTTPVDGDQPSLLIGLVTWAETLGFDIVAAGKSSEYDFVLDRASQTISSNGRTVPVCDPKNWWDMGTHAAAEIAGLRSAAAAALPQRAVPDLCELQIVANSTGLVPDRPDFHAPIARIQDVPTLFSERSSGGLLSGPRRIDVFHCLREQSEPGFAGGVFVIVRCDDRPTWDMLAEKGHLVSRDGANAMLYLPRHLLGLEAATSILEAVVRVVSSGAAEPRPVLDLIARAERDLPAGAELAMGGHHHTIHGVTGELAPGAALSEGAPVPFYLAANRRLARRVATGDVITFGDLEIDRDSALLALRRSQDAAFFGHPGQGRQLDHAVA